MFKKDKDKVYELSQDSQGAPSQISVRKKNAPTFKAPTQSLFGDLGLGLIENRQGIMAAPPSRQTKQNNNNHWTKSQDKLFREAFEALEQGMESKKREQGRARPMQAKPNNSYLFDGPGNQMDNGFQFSLGHGLGMRPPSYGGFGARYERERPHLKEGQQSVPNAQVLDKLAGIQGKVQQLSNQISLQRVQRQSQKHELHNVIRSSIEGEMLQKFAGYQSEIKREQQDLKRLLLNVIDNQVKSEERIDKLEDSMKKIISQLDLLTKHIVKQ